MKISYNGFKGIMPKIAIDKLPEFMAQVAEDTKTASGDLVAYRKPLADTALAGAAYKTLFEYVENANNNWVYYDLIVHWVRTPTVEDSFERVYMTGADADNGKYKAFVNDIQGGGSFDFTTDFYYPGAPSAGALVADNYTPGSDYRAYFWTYVSRYGEEGPASALTEISNYTLLDAVDLNGFDAPIADDSHLDTVIDGNAPAIRIYRTSSDADGVAAFLLVEEVAVDNTGPDGTAWATYEYEDTVLDADLGAVCTTILYNRAPDDLENLRGMPGGFFVASKGNTLYFSEPFTPWAWPEDYQIPIDQEIIGLGVYGSTIVVATDGHIYTFSGPHPTSLYKTKLDFQPCLSQRAVVETNSGVMFPSLSGFQHVTDGRVINVTATMVKPSDWADYELETMHSVWYNDAYYGFYKTADNEGFIVIDVLNGSITTGQDYHWAGYVGISGGIFYTVFPANILAPTTLYISKWDASTTEYKNYLFRSRQFILEKPQNFKVAQIILDTQFLAQLLADIADNDTIVDLNTALWAADDQLGGPLNDSMLNGYALCGDTLHDLATLGIQPYVNFRLYIDGVLTWTKQINSSTMFKLPRGFKDKKWEWSVEGMIPIKRVTLATSTEELV